MIMRRARNILSIIIRGEPASKANQRRLVTGKDGKARFIKSKKALEYVRSVEKQLPLEDEPWTEDVVFTAHIYYASRRPDLDASLILDVLQGRAYVNDRQVKEIHLYHHLDKEDPRAEITVTREGKGRSGGG